MSLKLKIGLLLVLGFLSQRSWLVAQSPGWYLILDAGRGQTLRHRSTMVFDLPRPAQALSLELTRQTRGHRAWAAAMRLPRWGVALHGQDYGNRPVLGYMVAVAPFFELPMLRRGPFSLWWRMNMGFAYHDRSYDRAHNPLNNAIGSALNNYTSFSLIGEAQLGERWLVRAGGHFVHQSNARSRLPNLGLNVPQWRVGLGYQLTAETLHDRLDRNALSYDRGWRYYLRLGLGQVEQKVAGGPRYPVWIISGYAARRISPAQRLLLGLEVSHDAALAAFMRNQDIPPGTPTWDPTRPAAWVGYELGSERLAMMGQVFLYLHDWPGTYGTRFWGTRFGPTYYFGGDDPEARLRPFVGMYLKTHLFIADYFETTVGLRF